MQGSQSPKLDLANSLVSPLIAHLVSPLGGIGASSFRREHSRRSVDGNIRLSHGGNAHGFVGGSLAIDEFMEPTDEGTEEFEIVGNQSKVGLTSASGIKGINSFNNSVISLR